MRSDMQATPGQLSSVSLYELNRLLRGPSLLSPLAHAALEFYPEKLGDVQDLAKAVIETFSIEELCALVGTIYLTRQVKKRCSDEEWLNITEILVPSSTLAGHLGCGVSSIGFEKALYTVAFSILGMALFQSSDSKEYGLYRRNLKKTNRYFSLENELKLFGCTSREIASLLSQTVAQSSNLASEFLVGPEVESGKRPATGIQALNIWIDSLSNKGSAPQEAMDAKWYPANDKVIKTEALAKQVSTGSSPTVSWILKEGSDLASLDPLLQKLGKAASKDLLADIDEDTEPFAED